MATAAAQKQPWQMTQAEFLTSKPMVTRNFQRYGTDELVNIRSSQRMGHRQKQAVGEFFYTNGADNSAYPTAKAAKIGLHRALIRKAWADGFVVPREVLAEYPDIIRDLAAY